MAMLPQTEIEQPAPVLTLDEAAAELYKIVEAHFDDLGLTEAQRDERYTSAQQFLDAKNAETSKS